MQDTLAAVILICQGVTLNKAIFLQLEMLLLLFSCCWSVCQIEAL